MLSCEDRKELLRLARRVVCARVRGERIEIPQEVKERFSMPASVFVTLRERGDLRGCIGTFQAMPLWQAVVEQAVQAAFHDPRFPPLQEEECDEVTFEISILSPLEEQGSDWYERLQPGVHGLLLDWGFTRSVFLPSVWRELPRKEDFVRALSLKAGLPPDAWRTAKAFFFTVEEFDEEHPCEE